MYFEVGKINEVQSFVFARAKKMGISVSSEDGAYFGAIIDSIKESRKAQGKEKLYKQGEDIDPEDHKNIRDAVQSLVELERDKLVARITANDPKMKDIKNTAEYFATYADVFYVNAMQQLGCPNMPLFMFDGGFRKTIDNSAISVHSAKESYKDIKTVEAYARQRYADAKDMDQAFNGIFVNIDKNYHTPRELGTLLAQYQALKIRQSNHGAIWRFFHRGENKARTEMLNKMDSYIRKALPKDLRGMNLDRVDPTKLARGIADRHIQANVELALTDRFTNKVEKFYGCQAADEFMMAQHRFDNENGKEHVFANSNIIDDVSIDNSKNAGQSEPIVGRSQDNIILDGLKNK